MKILTGVALSIAISFLLVPELAAQNCCDNGTPKKWKNYNKGVRWYDSLEEAKRVAAREGKLIMLHQLVGDMDKAGC
jgi:hypothetical protein